MADTPSAPPGAHAAPAHGHGKSHRREYFIVFGLLALFTIVEVVVANPSLGISRTVVGLTLVLLAVTKAAFVGYFYMHLKQEMKSLKLTVVIPFLFPLIYALVLISEAGWRLIRP
jgi:caa(3)-type oxidase subunit IV